MISCTAQVSCADSKRRLCVGFSERYHPERNEETPSELEGTVHNNGIASEVELFADSVMAELRTLKKLSPITHPQKTGVFLKTWEDDFLMLDPACEVNEKGTRGKNDGNETLEEEARRWTWIQT